MILDEETSLGSTIGMWRRSYENLHLSNANSDVQIRMNANIEKKLKYDTIKTDKHDAIH